MTEQVNSPWVRDKWRVEDRDGGKVLIWSERVLKPADLKRSILWWFRNDDDQTADEAGYHPEWANWKRQLYWNYFRNPLMNWKNYVAGAVDENIEVRVVKGNPDPTVTTRTDRAGEYGWQINEITMPSGKKHKWYSYSKKWIFQFGWQPSGKFELKISKNSEYKPA